jgi:hypothetical protein
VKTPIQKRAAADLRELASCLFDAQFDRACDVSDTGKHFEITDYPAKFRKCVEHYLSGIDFADCAAMYLRDNGFLIPEPEDRACHG